MAAFSKDDPQFHLLVTRAANAVASGIRSPRAIARARICPRRPRKIDSRSPPPAQMSYFRQAIPPDGKLPHVAALLRHVLRLHHLAQRGVVRIMYRWIEQRPSLGCRQHRGHRGGHEIAIILVIGRRFGGPAVSDRHVDPPQGKHELLERTACQSTLLPATCYAGVLAVG